MVEVSAVALSHAGGFRGGRFGGGGFHGVGFCGGRFGGCIMDSLIISSLAASAFRGCGAGATRTDIMATAITRTFIMGTAATRTAMDTGGTLITVGRGLAIATEVERVMDMAMAAEWQKSLLPGIRKIGDNSATVL